MRITDFEKNFLEIDGGNDEFNPYVIRLFHTLLQKVERDPYRKWTHDLLRNYVNASYCFCCNLNESRKAKKTSQDANAIRKAKIASQDAKSKEQKEQEKQEKKNESPQVNLYEDDDTNLKVFFTGLYTPGTYQGLKNGLYFVINPSVEPKISVKTRKEIFESDPKILDGKKVLRHIDHRDSFENELVDDEALYINKISLPDIIMSPEDANIIIKKKRIGDKIKGNPWLHILRDGMDNLPTDFVKSFFDKEYERLNPVERFNNRKKWIEECIQKSSSSSKDNDKSFQYYQEIMLDTMQAILDKSNIHNLPVHFFIKQNTYNYLLPMYLLNSGKPDFCIVLRHKKTDGKYTGDWEPVTSLDMDEVYCDIRVLGMDAIERVHNWW